MLSLRTDFFVDMSGQISSRRRQLSTKQWSGNKCSDVQTKIQTLSYALHSLDSALFANSQSFLKDYVIYIYFSKVSFLFQNSTSLCQQNRILVDMSYFLKIAVLSPILLTKRLSTTAFINNLWTFDHFSQLKRYFCTNYNIVAGWWDILEMCDQC